MQLSKFSDYALRVMMYVGLRGDQPCPVAEIAAAFEVSQHHLVKVAYKLTELGWLTASRGRGGGLSLAMAAEDIVVGEVVRQTENLDVVECMAGGACVLTGACELQRALSRARDAFLGELDVVTLADLLRSRRKLLTRLAPNG